VRRLLLAALVVAACRTAAPPVIERSPDPTAPPLVGATLDPTQLQHARSAVAAAERGDWAGAERFLAKLPPSHPVTTLTRLEVRFLHGEDVVTAVRAFAEELGDYGSAWALAALAATRAGDLEGSVSAARRVAVLQPDPRWDRMVAEGERTLLAAALREASSLLAAGDAAGALAKARGVLERAPGLTAARLLAVRAALAAGEPRTAAALLPALGDDPEATELKGRVAEALGQWEMAASLYASLPERHPGRCELLDGARDQLRYRDAPPYLTRAVGAQTVTRRGLAAILAWEAPALAQRAGGAVPVFEDIVQIAERVDIVTVARAGVIPGDAVARRFHPDRHVQARELRLVLERLAAALERPSPRWCEGEAAEGCLTVPIEPSGRNAAELVRTVAGLGGERCNQR
jgi:tetratricopeptide (TPR) repeat protein